MNADSVLLFAGLLIALVAFVRWSHRVASQTLFCLSTVNAQHSWLVSWSLAKACTFLLALDGVRRRPRGLLPFAPYVAYVVTSAFITSLFWDVPDGVLFFYGKGRVAVSVLNFGLTVFATMSLAVAVAGAEGGRVLWSGLRWLAIVHGTFSAYQYTAASLGWPVLGISRAHGLTLDGQVADVAIFVSSIGVEVLRAGGLAGEPKTAAVVFGTVLFSALHVGHRLDTKRSERLLTSSAIIFSFLGFVVTLSTSAVFGLGSAFVVGACLLRRRHVAKAAGIGVILLVVFSGLLLWSDWTPTDVDAVISERTVERFRGELDPPVEAAIASLATSLPIALFGVGEGGSTFLVMKYLNESFEYSYAPNIGLVRLAVENGLIGLVLFLGAYGLLTVRALAAMRSDPSAYRVLFLASSLCGVCMAMAGSGIPLGLPMAIATVYAAQAEVGSFAKVACGASVRRGVRLRPLVA